MDFGKQIKQMRLERKLTQEQMAEQLGVSRQAVSNWENNKNLPDLELIISMSSVLTYLYLMQLFFCFMPFHDILKRNGGDSLWQDQKHIILYSVTMKCQLFVRLSGIRKPVKPS